MGRRDNARAAACLCTWPVGARHSCTVRAHRLVHCGVGGSPLINIRRMSEDSSATTGITPALPLRACLRNALWVLLAMTSAYSLSLPAQVQLLFGKIGGIAIGAGICVAIAVFCWK